eukprot:TRINITY_DN19750_c0_g2_i1.p1 TRINITY_DN19750_c0_g2~~TRINITY_DN19750_c0_g2_i1.p1  ORF type:complete len:126 (+),score=3.69 TRINITY_DN19750_c0_g2_i1:225-602(+)
MTPSDVVVESAGIAYFLILAGVFAPNTSDGGSLEDRPEDWLRGGRRLWRRSAEEWGQRRILFELEFRGGGHLNSLEPLVVRLQQETIHSLDFARHFAWEHCWSLDGWQWLGWFRGALAQLSARFV